LVGCNKPAEHEFVDRTVLSAPISAASSVHADQAESLQSNDDHSSSIRMIEDRGSTAMSDLVVIAFPTEAKAEEVRQKLLAMQKEYLIELGDAVIAVKDAQGRIKLNQLLNTTAAGAVSGTFWGALIGLIFLMPLAGAALGAASGTLGGYLTDVGIDDKWMKETAAAIQPGTAALFVLVRKMTADKVLQGLKGEGGTVLKTSLDHTKEAALQAALADVQAAVMSPPEPYSLDAN
jgi:uncharacterized membrane protein